MHYVCTIPGIHIAPNGFRSTMEAIGAEEDTGEAAVTSAVVRFREIMYRDPTAAELRDSTTVYRDPFESWDPSEGAELFPGIW